MNNYKCSTSNYNINNNIFAFMGLDFISAAPFFTIAFLVILIISKNQTITTTAVKIYLIK